MALRWLACAVAVLALAACADSAARQQAEARRRADEAECRAETSDARFFDVCMRRRGWTSHTRPPPRSHAHKSCLEEACRWDSCLDPYGRPHPKPHVHAGEYRDCMERRGYPNAKLKD